MSTDPTCPKRRLAWEPCFVAEPSLAENLTGNEIGALHRNITKAAPVAKPLPNIALSEFKDILFLPWHKFGTVARRPDCDGMRPIHK